MRIFRLLMQTAFPALVCAVGLAGQAPKAPPVQDLLHKPAPEFARADLSGRKVELKSFRGKVVLLNFWATWCAPCQVELPKFESWQRKYGSDGLQILAVSMDDEAAPARRTARRLHLDFPVLMGNARLGEEYGGVLGLPVTFLIDRNGVVVAKIKGATDLKKMESLVNQLLTH
jgi:peroxiredoxin